MRTIFLVTSALLIAGANTAIADTTSDVVNDVRTVCTQPATQGKHWEVTGNLNADAGIQLKLLKVAGVQGDLHFSKSEWSGVQRVLAAQQGSDNADYRACAKALTPLFLEKTFPKKSVEDGATEESKRMKDAVTK